MDSQKINNSIDKFLNKKNIVKYNEQEKEECDLVTGECYIFREKDGIVERINKKYVTNDGRQLLQD